MASVERLIKRNQGTMNWTALIIYIIGAFACALGGFIYGLSEGTKQGIDMAMSVAISRTIDKVREAFVELGHQDIFDEAIEKAFNMAKIRHDMKEHGTENIGKEGEK